MKDQSLKGAVAFYLESRRRLGFALESEGALLENLVAYARSIPHRGPLTLALALSWAQLAPPAPSLQRARRLETVRHFAQFWATFDARTQIPPAGLFGPAYRRVPVHLYTASEIHALREKAQQLPPTEGLWPQTFTTLLGLLSCTGLRISEALGLEVTDWDPPEAVLTIRQSKFGQSRYLPVAADTAVALQGYLQARARAFPRSPAALFLNAEGKALRYDQASRTFARLRRHLGWQDRRPRPRLHDLRHTFTVNCLLGWYRQGAEELQAKILSLAVYLGHRNIRHTYWYLTAVPELLALGSARLAQALAAGKGAPHE